MLRFVEVPRRVIERANELTPQESEWAGEFGTRCFDASSPERLTRLVVSCVHGRWLVSIGVRSGFYSGGCAGKATPAEIAAALRHFRLVFPECPAFDRERPDWTWMNGWLANFYAGEVPVTNRSNQ